ncbi:hypothetical protein RhiirA5_404405 [Rhizophagus irregularis]|uniref:Uncharacterized protein n=1 Tax=Rhizophagus irregularis TaxID=588596 RepID=A0A2N0NQ34_9GLOM|nr:hypothetical protein RhiirA5_404405 [Rhizophagus irregularis]
MWILPDAVGIWKTVQSDANINFLSTPAPLKTQCNRRITSKYSKLGVLVYQHETTIYSMHHIKEGLHIVDTITNFTIPDNKDQLYVIDEVIEKVYFSKSRVMDYYLKLQDISRKVQKYSPTNEKPLEASPSKRKSARLQESSILHYSLH